MAGKLLNGSPTATSMNSPSPPKLASNDVEDGADTALEHGEEAASPQEEELLKKVMAAFYSAINDPQKIRQIDRWMMQSHDLGATIGQIAFKILSSIYASAYQSGTQIPVDVFFAQGGAVYQAIDRLMMIAEHSGVHDVDPDKTREDAMGTLVDAVKQMYGGHMEQGTHGAPPQGQPQPGAQMPQGPVAAANPLSHAVGQGLQQQGLIGG
jgi:hypothetical protein